VTEPSHAVFLSYASQDQEAVQRICDALRAAGIEVWFDRSELRGGDSWDQAIRRQIRSCALFLPIISVNTEARSEGYFRREWKLAVDRTDDMSTDVPFLVPVAIDDTPESSPRVPDRFRQAHWIRLPPGEVSPAFAARIGALLTALDTPPQSQPGSGLSVADSRPSIRSQSAEDSQARPRDPFAHAEFSRLTDFIGIEEQAAISRDGQFVAFVSDRDGPRDIFVGQAGSGNFENLTKGAISDLRNPACRVLIFSSSGSEVLAWTKTTDANGAIVDYQWTVPVAGGSLRCDCTGAGEADWSADGKRLVYHPSAPGDPLFVAAADDPRTAQQVYIAPPGIHCHFPRWSPDGKTVYFVRGFVPDEMDVWRVGADGAGLERLTWHNSRVGFPALLDERTLLYLATNADGSGPWVHMLDLERGTSHRLKTGANPYTSIAVSADGRHFVATETYATATLWRVSLGDGIAGTTDAVQIPIRTTRGISPRIGPDFLIYRAPKAGADALWRLEAGARTRELWSGVDSRCVAGPVLSTNGASVAFVVQRRGLTRLYVMSSDGSGARMLSGELEVRGAPSWSPDGKWVAIGILRGREPRLFKIPAAEDRPAVPLTAGYGTDPVWSPSGQFLVYTGEDVGTVIETKAVGADGEPYALPRLVLNRGSRRFAFGGDDNTLVFLRGALSQKEFWAIDLRSGEERPLTKLGPGPVINDFDVSRDGRTVVFDRVREESHIVRIHIAG